VEPKIVNPDSDLYCEHPDWVLHQPSRRRSELRNQMVLNFARLDVAAWGTRTADGLVAGHGIADGTVIAMQYMRGTPQGRIPAVCC